MTTETIECPHEPFYLVWDTGTANLVGEFDTLADVAAWVRALPTEWTNEIVNLTVTEECCCNENVRVVAEGAELLRL